jgi:hypothetical protein
MDYSPTLKIIRMQAVRDAIDAGSGVGKINIYSAGYSLLLVSIELGNPASSVDGPTLTFLSMPRSGVGVGKGTGAIARILDSDDNIVASGLTVGAIGANIIIDVPDIKIGQIVNFNSGRIIHG